MIRERDGIHVGEVVCDARSASGAANVVSHAHTDHLPRGGTVDAVCSDITAALGRARTGADIEPVAHPGVELLPAGHIVGSRAALIEHREGTVLYTGDVCTRDRLHLDGFEPVDADVLVIEATYGTPRYTFPPFAEVERDVLDWMDTHPDRPLLLAGYSLGKAQKIQGIAGKTGRRVLAHESVMEMNSVIADAGGPVFDAAPLADAGELQDELVVAPPGALRGGWAAEMQREHGSKVAGFSGWATTGRYGRYDASFPLSDHCDFTELVEVVERVDPDAVYTHHGAAQEFAAHLQGEGYEARALGEAQASLREFAATSTGER